MATDDALTAQSLQIFVGKDELNVRLLGVQTQGTGDGLRLDAICAAGIGRETRGSKRQTPRRSDDTRTSSTGRLAHDAQRGSGVSRILSSPTRSMCRP